MLIEMRGKAPQHGGLWKAPWPILMLLADPTPHPPLHIYAFFTLKPGSGQQEHQELFCIIEGFQKITIGTLTNALFPLFSANYYRPVSSQTSHRNISNNWPISEFSIKRGFCVDISAKTEQTHRRQSVFPNSASRKCRKIDRRHRTVL